MSKLISISRSEKTGNWVKARPTGGCCFTINFDRLEGLLQEVGSLKEGESVERYEIDQYGITVFIKNANMKGGSKYRV